MLNHALRGNNTLALNQKLLQWSPVSKSIYLNVAYIGKIKDASYRDQLYLIPNLLQMRDNLDYLGEHGVTRIYEGGTDLSTVPLSEIRQKVLQRIVSNPDVDENEMLEVLLGEAYGNAATPITTYLQFIKEKIQADATLPVYRIQSSGTIRMSGKYYMTASELTNIRKCYNDAKKAAKTDEEKALVESCFAGYGSYDGWKNAGQLTYETWENYAMAELVLDFPQESNCKLTMKMNSGEWSASSMLVAVDQKTLCKVKTKKEQTSYDLLTQKSFGSSRKKNYPCVRMEFLSTCIRFRAIQV